MTGRPDVAQAQLVDSWSSPTTVHAWPGAAAGVLGDLGSARVLLVTDADVWSTCPALRDATGGVAVDEVVTRTSDDTDLATLHRVVAAIERHRDAVLVAAGGGSVMDVTRLAGLLSADVKASASLLPRVSTTQGLLIWPSARNASCPVLCVPTTIGTAAEVSPVAMVRTDTSTTMVVSPALRSTVAVLDPTLTSTLGAARLRSALVEPLGRVLVPAVAGGPLALQDAIARTMAELLLDLGRREDLDDEWRLTAALASTQTHTAFLPLGRAPFGHVLWPLATELSAQLRIDKSAALGVLMPAWLEGIGVGELGPAFGTPDRVSTILGLRPQAAATMLRCWCAAVLPSGGAPGWDLDVDQLLSRTLDRWQVGDAFLLGVGRAELAWLARRAMAGYTAP